MAVTRVSCGGGACPRGSSATAAQAVADPKMMARGNYVRAMSTPSLLSIPAEHNPAASATAAAIVALFLLLLLLLLVLSETIVEERENDCFAPKAHLQRVRGLGGDGGDLDVVHAAGAARPPAKIDDVRVHVDSAGGAVVECVPYPSQLGKSDVVKWARLARVRGRGLHAG